MKSIFCLLASLSLYCTAIAQAEIPGQVTPDSTGTPMQLGPHNNFSTDNTYYGANVAEQYKARTNEDLFATYPDFPRYQDTGNLANDIPAYKARVTEWIRNHEDFRKKVNIKLEDLKN